MTVEVTTLANGLKVVSENMPHIETVSLGVWVSSGARHETGTEHGISHFLEHMAFKGTRRRSAQAIAEEIENVGGEINAATSLEMTAYYARVLRDDIALALDILADILQDSQFSPDELEREREVILQEIASTKDSPEELAYDLMQDGAFPRQPLGRPILGTTSSVRRITGERLKAYLKQHYAASRMIVGAAGAVDHGALVKLAGSLFGGLNGKSGVSAEAARYEGGTRSLKKPFEQSHLVLAFESPSINQPDYVTAQVMSALFGGGMSSRLFQEVRERRGLCYAIYSFVWGLADTGLFGIHAATGPDLRDQLIEVLKSELERLATESPSEAEIRRSKAQIKAGLLMSLESSSVRAEQMARQLMAFGRTLPPEELIQRIDLVDGKAIRDLAGRVLGGPVTISEVGAAVRSDGYCGLVKEMVKA
ncbi:MAG: insulinase family protein [Hyphomicrobiaceae bacterium]|nr:MAG: insulinase family protein [Hyphomicrobiaceae bacterium]